MIGIQKTVNVPSGAGVSNAWGFQLDQDTLALSPPTPVLPGWALASSHPA